MLLAVVRRVPIQEEERKQEDFGEQHPRPHCTRDPPMRRRILLRARPPRDPEAEQRERDAYERTHRVLLGLPEQQWTVVSPYEQRHGPPGHVLVGPGGIYLILSRQPDGSVRVKDGVPWLRRRSDRDRE